MEWALAEVGVREDPPGSNAGPPLERYALPGEPPLAWCGRFVRAAFKQAGTPLPGNPWLIPSVAELQRALAAAGAWIPIAAAREAVRRTVGQPSAAPARGDLLLLNRESISDVGRRGNHVGIVVRFLDDTVRTVDGNWSDAVRVVDRHLDDPTLWGLGRWPPR